MKRFHVMFWAGDTFAGETTVTAWTAAGAVKKALEKKSVYGADRVTVRRGDYYITKSC